MGIMIPYDFTFRFAAAAGNIHAKVNQCFAVKKSRELRTIADRGRKRLAGGWIPLKVEAGDRGMGQIGRAHV